VLSAVGEDPPDEARLDGVIIHFIDISQIQRSRDEAARAHRHQAALTHMGLAALDLVPSAQTLQRLVAEVQRSLAADLTGWFELTDEGKKLILRAGYGWNEPNVAFRVSSSNPVALALQQAGPVAVGDIREMRFESIPVLHHEDVISLVACAVHARPGTLGVLAVFSRRKAGFDAFDATFLEGATHVFAHAADRDRAEAELREARRVAENEKSRLERLFMEAPALIALHEGPEHVYTFSNRLHDEALGRRPLLGRSVREAVPEVIGSGVIERFDDVYRTGTPALVGEFDIDLPGPGGKGRTTRQFSQVVQRHHDPEGRPVGVMTFAMDVTDQVEARRKVEESEGRLQRTADELRVIYDTAPVGLALMNRNMEWVRLNPSLAQLDGHTVDEHLGRSLPDLLQETGSVIAVDIERVFVTGEPVMGVEVEVNREGEERSFVASYIPLWNDTRTEVRLVSAVVQETTDAKRYQQALIEAGQRRDEFLAMLSHELRNPVAAINNAVELLAMEDRREEDLHASVDVLGRQAVHMTRMVDDLLDAARLSRGKVSLHKTALDLGRLVKGVVADHQAAADRAHVLLKSRRLDREVEVLGDATRLTQILSNLLTNAVRFTPPQGEVQVEMRPLPGAVQVRVTDSGPGITPEFQQRMFEAFEQGEQSRGPQAGGLGLGLAIARGFAELHGGTLRAEDRTSEGGAVLVLELPRRESSSGEPRARGSTPKLEILLVEDNPDVAQMTKRLLSREGHQVRLLDHGEDVLKEVEARRPDGILCDVGLPGMSGLE
ncbi:MAG: ATP-binding protein, partial [Myxococcota bacterium]